MQLAKNFRFVPFVLAGALVVGCGQSGPNITLVPASGKLTANGQPLANVAVGLHGDAPRIVTGITNASGEFVLGTFKPGDGAPPGRYRVTLAPGPAQVADEGRPVTMEEALERGGQAQPVQSPAVQIPEIYRDPKTTPLEVEIKAGEKNYLELKIGG